MKSVKWLTVGVLALTLQFCSSSKSRQETGGPSGGGQTTLLEVLTDFSIALNGNDFNGALEFLTSDEKAKVLASGSGTITPDIKVQLKALNLQTLIKNPNIRLILGGKLVGIADALPKVENLKQPQDSALPVEAAPAVDSSAISDTSQSK